jgi:hypothetical protein
MRLDRIGDRLAVLGEGAGVDFKSRSYELNDDIRPVISAYRALPGVPAIISKNLSLLQKKTDEKLGLIPKAENLAKQNRWDDLETLVYAAVDELEVMGTWYDTDQRKRSIWRFRSAAAPLLRQCDEARKNAVQEALTQARSQQSPQFDALLGEIRKATAALKTAGTVDVGGQPLTGPALLRLFAQRWTDAQAAALRCQGLTWIIEASSPEFTALAQTHAKFSQDVVPALADLIAADVAHVTAENARARYVEYLRVLGPIVSLTADDKLAEAVGPRLAEVASKSPELAAEVEAYRKATSQLLRWRARTAAAYAKARQLQFPPVEQQFLAAVKDSPEGKGLVSEKDPSTAEAALPGNVSAPTIMERASKKLVGQPALVARLVGLPTAAKMACSRYGERTYSRVALPSPPLDAQFAGLRGDLMVDKGPPLTLEAAAAIMLTQRGDLEAVGGEIKGAYLEPLVWRFAALPPILQTLLPLGATLAERQDTPWTHQVVMRFDVGPKWVQSKYYFVELP